MELEKAVEKSFGEIVESGMVEKIIKKQLEETIAGIIRDAVREYSDFGKSIKDKVNKALDLGEMKIDLPSYNQTITDWILEMINTEVMISAKAQIEGNIRKMIKPLEKSEWKISEIIEAYKAEVIEDACGDDVEGDITFEVKDDNRGFIYYSFDKENGKTTYGCDYRIGTHQGKVFTVQIDGDDGKKMKSKPLVGFDSFIYQLYATQATIVNDADSVDTYIANQED